MNNKWRLTLQSEPENNRCTVSGHTLGEIQKIYIDTGAIYRTLLSLGLALFASILGDLPLEETNIITRFKKNLPGLKVCYNYKITSSEVRLT